MATLELRPNQRIGNWKLEKQLGEGGQASVWLVKHVTEHHCQPGAVKICKDLSPKAIARFQQEIQLLKDNRRPGIVTVRDEGVYQERPFFVMERATTTLENAIKGETEGTRLLRESPALLLELFRGACQAVAHLHSNGVLHRDIKPSNILLFLSPKEAMRSVISDLGIGSNEEEQGQLTATHESIGTPIYRAPEATYGKHTKAADVYSLGKTLEHVFSRKVPPTAGPGRCSRDAWISDELWDALDAILERACHMDPKERYRDAGELVSALPTITLTTKSAQVATSSRVVRESALAARVEAPMAAAIGAGVPITAPSGNMIVDIGGGTTEVAVISLAGIVVSKSIRVGGDKLDEAIVQYIKRKYNLLIGERTAEDIRKQIGSAYALPEVRKMAIIGRDLIAGVPKQLNIDSDEIRDALAESIDAIVEAVRVVRDRTPPDLLADLVDKGIVLSGDDSQLQGLDLLLRDATGLPVVVSETPQRAVVLGSGKALDEILPLQRDSLSKDEQMVLLKVIGHCPTDGDVVGVWQLQPTKSQPDYTFSLAFRRLKQLGLIGDADALDEHGERYPAVRPTENGIQWAQAHRQQELENEIPF